jgi:hypothetical protein
MRATLCVFRPYKEYTVIYKSLAFRREFYVHKLKQKEEGEKDNLCSNGLLARNLPHKEES